MPRTAQLVAVVVVADSALSWLDGMGGWALVAYAVAVALTMAARGRLPFAAFLAALALALVTGGSLALLVCTGFQAGQRLSTRRDLVVTAAGLIAYVCACCWPWNGHPAGRTRGSAWPASSS
ncbi:hypothetical protein GCM10020220_042190 [Nonomuraea rubra]|uniref:hypothetical protein n=1 Tax=Nonomuraea rubra TaxID=46180 RepID=UPI0031EDCBA4